MVCVITGCNEVVAKVIFLHLSVIHSVHRGGRGSASVHAGIPPPPQADTPIPDQTPPGTIPPLGQTPPRADTLGSRLQHTVYERPVRILLECILVLVYFIIVSSTGGMSKHRSGYLLQFSKNTSRKISLDLDL